MSYAPKLHTLDIVKITSLSQESPILCQIVVLCPLHLHIPDTPKETVKKGTVYFMLQS